MAEDDPLKLVTDFFGADEALTIYSPNAKEWVATLLCKRLTHRKTWTKSGIAVFSKFLFILNTNCPDDQINKPGY